MEPAHQYGSFKFVETRRTLGVLLDGVPPGDELVLGEGGRDGKLESLDAGGDPRVLEGELLELLGEGETGRGESSGDGGLCLVDGESEGGSSEDRHGRWRVCYG